MRNIKNDAPNTIIVNFDLCPLIIENTEVNKPIQAMKRLITDGNGSGNLASKVLKKEEKKDL